MSKAADAFRTISEIADELGVPKHVLRFWELKFPQLKPMKRGGGRRYYRPEDLELLRGIRHLLHADGYTIKGVQKILREQGIDAAKTAGRKSTLSKPARPAITKKSAKSINPPSKNGAGSPQRARAQTRQAPSKLSPATTKLVVNAIKELSACRDLLRAAPIAEKAQKASPKHKRIRAAR